MSDIGARLKAMLDESEAARIDPSDIVARLRAVLHNDRSVELMNREAADEIERLRKWIELVQQQNADLRERVTMLVESAAEDARRVCALEDIIRKKGAVL